MSAIDFESGFALGRHAWPAHHTVAELPGSLPMGGVVADTPVHAFVATPERLRLREGDATRARREDIELGGALAFRVAPVLDAPECQALIDAGEQLGFREEAPGIATPRGMRMNKTVHWVADEALLGPILRRIESVLPAHVDGRRLLPALSHRINMYRYDDGDVFNIHIDGDWPGYGLSADRQRMQPWPAGRSCLSMLLYLNGAEDGVQGGRHTPLAAGRHGTRRRAAKGLRTVLPPWPWARLGAPRRLSCRRSCGQVSCSDQRHV